MRQICSTLELLEPRITPSNLAASLVNGVLVVQPADSDSNIFPTIVQLDSDSFDLLDYDEPYKTFHNVVKVRVIGSDQTDLITLDFLDMIGQRFRGNVAVLGQGGYEDRVTVPAGRLGGDLRVELGNEGDFFTEDGTMIGGTLRLTGTDDYVAAELRGRYGDVVTKGVATHVFDGVEVLGSVDVTAGPFGGSGFVMRAGTTVGGAFTFHNVRTFDYALQLQDSVLRGPVTLELTRGVQDLIATRTTFGSDLTVLGGPFENVLQFSEVTALGPVRLASGDGSNEVTFADGSSLASRLTVTGNGAESHTVVSVEGSSLARGVTARAASGGIGVGFYYSELSGGAILRAGAGGAGFYSDVLSTVAGRVDLVGGADENSCTIEQVGDLRGVRFVGGASADSLYLGGMGGEFLNVEASFGAGADSAEIRTAGFSRVVMDGGAGRDTLINASFLSGAGASVTSFEIRP